MVNQSFAPSTLKEALAIRAEYDVRPIAGGTDLMVRYRRPAGLLPAFDRPLLFLRHLNELKILRRTENGLIIGAGVTLRELEDHPETPELLRHIIGKMASHAIRSEATLAGNIGNASPAGDSLPYLYAANAELLLISLSGERVVPITDFITGPGRTALRSDELISEIRVPTFPVSRTFYRKVGGRRSDAISKLSFLGTATTANNLLTDLRIAFGSVAVTVIRRPELEAELISALNNHNETVKEKAVATYAELIRPIDDQRSTAAYRKQCALNLLRRYLAGINA